MLDDIWISSRGPILIKDMQLRHLGAAIHYVENKARYVISQITILSRVIHVDLVSRLPSESELRRMIAPQYDALRWELERRSQESELSAHIADGCDDPKCSVIGCPNYREM
jgi:hypothetical protein